MSKRRKGQDLFSKEAVKLRLTNHISARNEIKSIANREPAVLFDFSSLNETGSAITGEEEIVLILAVKLTMLGLPTLVAAIKHIPEAYNRSGMTGYTSLRSYFIGKIIEKAGFQISNSDLDVFVKIIESRCQTLLRSTNRELIDGVLWSLTEQENINFNVLLLPPLYQHEWKLEKREIVWKHDARRAECFHPISSFSNFHEC